MQKKICYEIQEKSILKNIRTSTHCWPDEVDHFYVSIVIQILTGKTKNKGKRSKRSGPSFQEHCFLPRLHAGRFRSCWVHVLYLLMASTRSTWCSAEQCCSVAATELSALRTHTVRKQVKHRPHYNLWTSRTHSGENKTFEQSKFTKTVKRKNRAVKTHNTQLSPSFLLKRTYFAASLHQSAKNRYLLLEL